MFIMFIRLACIIGAFQITRICNFELQDSYNVLLKDSAHYKIDITINEAEHEMISSDEANRYNIGIAITNQLRDLNRLAGEEYNKTVKLRALRVESFNSSEPESVPFPSYAGANIDTVATQEEHVMKKRHIEAANEPIYNYDDLLKEYYAEAIEDATSHLTYKVPSSNDMDVGFVHAVKMFLLLTTNMDKCAMKQSSDGIRKECGLDKISFANIIRVWKMIKIWLIIYLIIALPLWCTRGWCCCCFFCKFCKPKKTIEQAKRYLTLNPPGVLIKKGAVLQYEPSTAEKEAYEEFEHFLRTL